jgi:hypothetical protein
MTGEVLLALACAVILGSESYETHDHILLSKNSESLLNGWVASKTLGYYLLPRKCVYHANA